MEIGKLDWNDLRYFLAAARIGSLAGAARKLGVKHSTVSRRLTALERALGVAVVVRGEHGLQLTATGEKLLPFAEQIERTALDLQTQANFQTAHVRVGVPTGLVKFFARHLDELRREHPEIVLVFLSSSEPVDLHKGEAELALRVGQVTDESLIARKIGRLGWSLYASDSYLARRPAPKDPRDLAGHEVLGFDSRLAAMPGGQWIAEHGAGATIAMVNREIVDMAAAAVAGVGLAILPCIVGDHEPGLKRLTDEVLGCQNLFAVYRREAMLAKPVATVLRFLTRIMRSEILA